MTSSTLPHPECIVRSAADLLLRWPAQEPLAALVSGGTPLSCGTVGSQNAWTILARPVETIVIAAESTASDALAQLELALSRTPRQSAPQSHHAREIPFTGGWILALGYALGECFEPRAACDTRRAAPSPRAVLHWCDDAWCFDHTTSTLHAIGNPPALSSLTETPAWQLHSMRPRESDAQYAASVARAIEYIRAGDAYQANIARRFDGVLSGSARAFAHAAISENHAWFGACVDLPCGGCLVSMSPELFLRASRDGSIATRPIKGTRSADVPARELLESTKDCAELAMIVDLMRNDLGRVAEIGSVEVAQSRMLETHRTVHHGVAEIRAQLRNDASWMDVLRATFPPGSVTGAPKVRAMQIIQELEETERGFYCGGIGFISASGNAALSVAIRTAQVGAADADNARVLTYHAGCGIVIESELAAEVAETHAKARAVLQLAQSGDVYPT